MAKNIVVCSDGTGNTAVKGRGTNVFKFFEAIDLNGDRSDPRLPPQVAFYDDGVGTESFKPLKVFAGMTGFGLSRNVRQLYKEVSRVYDPGDRLFLVGFSRGAFTVRTLAGLITRCGLLDVRKLETARALEGAVAKCYATYRRRYRTELAKLFLGEVPDSATEEFRCQYCLEGEPPNIGFLGVWDTVDAVGLPFHLSDVVNTTLYRFKFPDATLSPRVERACHALALDDERHSFHPLLWDEREEKDGRIRQVWFSGSHSNVGGGYPKQGMSLVALDWMMAEAERAGLRFVPADRAQCADHANVDDKLYDPRAGLGIFYRWYPREMARMCARSGVRPIVHQSVLERLVHRTDDYSPGNLPAQLGVAITVTGDRAKDDANRRLAEGAETILANAGAGKGLFDRVRPAVVLGWVSYYVYLVSCTLVLLGAITLEGWTTVVPDLFTSSFSTLARLAVRVWSTPVLFWGLALGLGSSYLLSLYTDHRMSEAFSGFWHRVQPKLREAMKRIHRMEQKAA